MAKKPKAELILVERGRGRPAHVPTDASRSIVSHYAAMGVPHDLICAKIEVSDETLRKYYKQELKVSKAELGAELAGTLVARARAGSDACLIFWLKTQMRWRETTHLEHTMPSGEPLGVDVSRNESREEWLERQRIESQALLIEDKTGET